MIATLVSGLIPARRATQVDPVEAMREADTPGGRRIGRRRIVVALAVIGLGVATLFVGLFGGASGSEAAALLGLGVVVMIFGVALLAPILVKPLARVIGAPMERFQGLPGRLARENAERQPQRTAITASALMIGLALVVFTAIFADGLRASVNKVIDDQFGRSALIVTHDDGFSPVPAGVGEELARLPGVTTVSAMRFDQAKIRDGGDAVPASGVDPVHHHEGLPARVGGGQRRDARRPARRPGAGRRRLGGGQGLRGRRHDAGDHAGQRDARLRDRRPLPQPGGRARQHHRDQREHEPRLEPARRRRRARGRDGRARHAGAGGARRR